jgi:hypothetical protein
LAKNSSSTRACSNLSIANNRGTISHQHGGVGRDHAPYMPVEKG